MPRWISALLLCALCACAREASPTPREPVDETVATPEAEPVPVTSEPEPPPLDERHSPALLSAAAKYREWGRVDERPNIAPMLCRAPIGLDFGFPSHARLSEAEAVHGRKLYYLFAGLEGQSARDRYARLAVAGQPASELPVGFTVVKESWTAVASSSAPERPAAAIDSIDFEPPAPVDWIEHEGQILRAGEQADLFIMIKAGAADMPGTDAGWIYGTVSADGKQVTSAGLLEQCMACHEAATHERLFGLQQTKALVEIPKDWDGKPVSTEALGVE